MKEEDKIKNCVVLIKTNDGRILEIVLSKPQKLAILKFLDKERIEVVDKDLRGMALVDIL